MGIAWVTRAAHVFERSSPVLMSTHMQFARDRFKTHYVCDSSGSGPVAAVSKRVHCSELG